MKHPNVFFQTVPRTCEENSLDCVDISSSPAPPAHAGIPTTVSGQKLPQTQTRQGDGGKHAFPAVLKDELPSSVILRYMDGITKKIQKVTDLKLQERV